MQRDSSSGSGRVFSFLIAFTVLFVVVFGLGVFVGKRLSQQELKITKRFDEAPPEPSPAPVEEAPETEAEQISESPPPVTEEAAIESPPPAAEDEKKEIEKKNVEKESDAVKEVKEAAAPERTDTAAPVKPDERLAEITREIERELDKKTTGKKKEDGDSQIDFTPGRSGRRIYGPDRVFSGSEAGERPRERPPVEGIPRVYKIHGLS